MTQNSNLGFTQDSNPDPNRAPSSNQSSESYRKRSGAHLWAAVSYSLSSFSEIRHKADPLFGDSSSQSRGGAEPQPLTDIVPVRPTLEQLRDCTQPPVVLVHGLFGFGPDEMLTPKGRVHYWETAIDRDTNFHGLLVLEASVGPISSYHDRACELFAQIVGCRVDYGEQHSLTHRHDRYGRDFSDKPLYPWWSEDRPLHFVGHSAGGNTIRQLQHLLQLDFWDRGTNASWVKSVTCIMAPMNGSTASYLAGCNVETGLFGLSNIVPLISMVDTLGAAFGFPVNERRRMLLWKLEHFNISQDDFSDFNRLRQRMSESGFLLGEDNLAYDLTLQSCEKFNALVPDFPNTYYLSYTASCSTYTQVKTFMAGPYLYMRNRKFSAMPPGWSWSRDWQISDGLVPLASQMSPSGPLPRTMVCLSVPEESAANAADKSAKSSTNNGEHDSEKIQRGIWYTESMASVAQSVTKHWDHCDVICARGLLWEGIVDRIPVISNGAQALMGLGKRLGRLPKERSSLARVSKAEQRRFYEALYARLSQLE
uniref:AB hydrolase-1 domain-containing protein n=1 Tax=Macrostomum lignano TaxID=282301 RepID=A0A1I8GNG8_9PLAT